MAALDLQSEIERAAQAAAQGDAPIDLSAEIETAAQAAAEPNFLGRITERLRTRGEEFRELKPPETVVESLGRGVQTIGMGAGGVLDVAGETVSTGFDLLSKAASAVTPDFIEDPIVKGVGNAFESIVGTDIAQKGLDAAGKGIEAYQEFSEANPETAATLESLVNIALVAAPVKVKPRPAGVAPTAIGRAGQRVASAAVSQQQAARASFIDDLIRPRTSKAVREAEIGRTAEGGLVTGRTVTPSAAEQTIAATVTDVAGVTPKNTLLQNLNVVQAEIGAEAKSLASILEASTVKIGRQTIKSDMDDVLTRLADNPILVGDAARTGERTVARAKAFLDANPNTPAGVFKARQEFDAWVRTQRPKVFDPNTESALSIAVRETRQAMNNIVATNAPETGVKASLARQSALFDAVANIGPKAADEASTAIGRLGQSVNEALGLKRTITQNIPQIVTGGAILGGGALAPAALATGIAVVGTGVGAAKILMSPATKRAVSALLRQTDEAIQAAQGNAELLKQLRLDRAAVVELLKNAEGSE